MITVKLRIALLVVILLFYVTLVLFKGGALIAEGGTVPVLLGIALIISAAMALGLVIRELKFGHATAKLGAVLDTEGGLSAPDLPRRPSGRVDRAAADAYFEQERAIVEADAENWRGWYRLALAYDLAGDRTRGRAAARHALELYHQE